MKNSNEKSVVLHYGSENKCVLPCPKLKVHQETMDKKVSTKYLGNILSTTGGLSETIEDRRGKGWGNIATIMGILSTVDMGVHRLEAGLMLRQAILINSLLYSAEAWSGVTDKQLRRLEVVDRALLVRLTGGHSKCASEFYHLECGTWQLRHHLMYRRLMYHHHLITREASETIQKIYYKQKEETYKGDWYDLLKKDFEFLGEEMLEEKIKLFPKIPHTGDTNSLDRCG